MADDTLILVPELPARLAADLPYRRGAAWKRLEFPFTGAMVLDEHSLKMGRANYADVQNLRYTNAGLRGVQGYRQLTTTALERPRLRSGLQFVKATGGLPVSYLLVQAWHDSLLHAHVFSRTIPVPSPGDFTTPAVWSDSPGAGLGRFAVVPDGTMVYCNGVDSTIWSSPDMRVGSVVNYDDPGGTFRYDLTDKLTNILHTPDEVATLVPDVTGDIWLLIGAVRPIQGIHFVVDTPNTAATVSTVQYWNGTTWAGLSGFEDGTRVGGVSLAQSGTMTFPSTVQVARVRFLDERVLYYYRVRIGATGTPSTGIRLAQVSVDAPMQPIVDLWDGVERTPIMFQVAGRDYTNEILVPSSSAAPIAADLNGLALGNEVLVGFEERLTALQLRMISDQVNVGLATLSLAYWNGTAWTHVLESDGTAVAGVSLAQSGAIVWNAPAGSVEYRQTLFGRTGYYYRLTWSDDLSNTDILLDTVTGIPAQRWNAQRPIFGYTFPFVFAGRVMLAGSPSTNELHRIDYSAPLRPVVWNGDQASDQGKQLYIGEHHALTAAIEMSNRYANTLTSMAIVLKHSETWIMQGTSPEDFTAHRMSTVVGCPAPLSLTLAEIPLSTDQQAMRNVALWCSAKGPVMTDGNVILPLRFPQPDGAISSVEVYFDPTDVRCVNTRAWERVCGWYDARWSEYNLLVPSGDDQTDCNVWLCCDLRRRKWFRKVPTVFPQMAFQAQDVQGVPYILAGIDSGHLLRLEHGTTWEGDPIAHLLDTADILPENSAWDTTLLRHGKLVVAREPGVSAVLTLAHAGDGAGVYVPQATLDLVGGSAAWRKTTFPLNLNFWSHQWRLTVTTDDKVHAPELLGLGFLYSVTREET